VRVLRVGPGESSGTQIGPVITSERVETTLAAVENAERAGARIQCGGGRALVPGAQGHYLQPAVIDRVDETMELMADEIFAPVLPVATARDRDHAVHLANLGSYGLSASVYSRDADAAAAVARRIEAGIVHVNLHTAYREPQLPVAAWRDSGRGIPECGRFAREFFTRPRAIYIRS
jgi:aldehyde dehydrogenase (NAD+)